MGAFDGIRIPYDKGYPTSGFKHEYDYFPNQPAFDFFKGFGAAELKLLLTNAEIAGNDTVWVPHEHPGNGHKGLSIWYVRALIAEHFGEDC